MNTEREKNKKMWNIEQKGAKREKKDLNYIWIQILRHKEWSDKKIIKLKRLGTSKLCWADQVKSEFGGHFGGQKEQKVKLWKTDKLFLAIFGKTVSHKGLKFDTGSFLLWMYIFIF